jgi:ribose-phosphate pyrophosphokinase
VITGQPQPRITVYDEFLRNAYDPDMMEFLTFHGGEPHVKIHGDRTWLTQNKNPRVIDARLTSYNDLGYLHALVNVMGDVSMHELLVPYFPGSRQDHNDRPQTARLYADQFLSMGFKTITTIDPHSDVCVALADANVWDWTPQGLPVYTHVVAPDAGAQHRTEKFAAKMGIKNVIQALKTRDQETGRLSGFQVLAAPSESVRMNILVFDDIIDGGGTFIPLAEELNRLFPNAGLDIFATHGIFSAGTAVLRTQYKKIFSSTSFRTSAELTRLGVTPLRIHTQEVTQP